MDDSTLQSVMEADPALNVRFEQWSSASITNVQQSRHKAHGEGNLRCDEECIGLKKL